ncbi:amidohydrolase family protein [Spirillospora sp. NPDC050679]
MGELLVSAGRVLPGPAGAVVEDGAVLVRDGRIAWTGPRAEAPRAPDVEHPDGTLLPGLIDVHVHLAFDAGPELELGLAAASDEELYERMAGNARRLLAAGVTTVRDLGDRGGLAVRLRDAVAAGALPGPRVLAACAPVTPPNGHCHFLGGVAQGVEGVREAVRRNAAAGADVIKVMAGGGYLTNGGALPWERQFTDAELAAVVVEARAHGLRVAAHAHGVSAIAASVRAGADTIEHCGWEVEGGATRVDDALVERIAADGIAVCPTVHAGWPGIAARRHEGWLEERLAILGRLRAAGVRLAFGTDTGVRGAPFGRVADALALLVDAGLSPAEALESATVTAADACGLGGVTGRLAPGLRADLLVVGGDPTADVRRVDDVRLVIADGADAGVLT